MERSHDIEEWIEEYDTIMARLTEDERLLSEKGPYAEFASTPKAIRAYLSNSPPSDIDTIVEHLLEGGFVTESRNFKHVVRVALGRLQRKSEAVCEEGAWSLIPEGLLRLPPSSTEDLQTDSLSSQ